MKKAIFLIVALIFSTLLIIKINAQAIADPSDIFYVEAPGANQKVSGTINISWRMYDDEQSVIPYTAKLFDSGSCENTYYGQINSNPNGASNSSQNNNLSWNTNSTQSISNLSDGYYCLKVCVALKDGATPYSACNSRIVRIVNHNRYPTINSTPSNLTIHESDSWQYQINASDADGDTLTYRLIYSTGFLNINAQTGMVVTNSNRKLPNGLSRVDYRIVVGVDDNLSGTTTQEFYLTVISDVPAAPPPLPPGPTPTPVPQPEPEPTPDNNSGVNQVTNINIISPKEADILRGNSNEIKWEVDDADGIAELTIQYAEDGTEFINLKTYTDEKEIENGTYTWDVSNLKDAIYYINIIVKDKKGIETSRRTEAFEIKNNQEEENESSPQIVNVKPENETESDEVNPTISGEFIPSTDQRIRTDTFKITLDGNPITENCNVSDLLFVCELDEELNEGKHIINAEVRDTSGQKVTHEWTFGITIQKISENQEDIINLFGNEIPKSILLLSLIVCAIAGLLILIPWIIYVVWKRHKIQSQDTSINTTIASTPNISPGGSSDYSLPPLPDYSYNYNNYTPQVTSEPSVSQLDTKEDETTQIESIPENKADNTKKDSAPYQPPVENIQPVNSAPVAQAPAQNLTVIVQPQTMPPESKQDSTKTELNFSGDNYYDQFFKEEPISLNEPSNQVQQTNVNNPLITNKNTDVMEAKEQTLNKTEQSNNAIQNKFAAQPINPAEEKANVPENPIVTDNVQVPEIIMPENPIAGDLQNTNNPEEAKNDKNKNIQDTTSTDFVEPPAID